MISINDTTDPTDMISLTSKTSGEICAVQKFRWGSQRFVAVLGVGFHVHPHGQVYAAAEMRSEFGSGFGQTASHRMWLCVQLCVFKSKLQIVGKDWAQAAQALVVCQADPMSLLVRSGQWVNQFKYQWSVIIAQDITKIRGARKSYYFRPRSFHADRYHKDQCQLSRMFGNPGLDFIFLSLSHASCSMSPKTLSRSSDLLDFFFLFQLNLFPKLFPRSLLNLFPKLFPRYLPMVFFPSYFPDLFPWLFFPKLFPRSLPATPFFYIKISHYFCGWQT